MTKASLLVAVLSVLPLAEATSQNAINVRLAGGDPGIPSGAAVIGGTGNTWNYFPNLGGRAGGGGVVTNAATIKDSSGTTVAGVTMTMVLSGGDGLDSYTDGNSFNPTPVMLMGHYVYENNGVNYFTFSFAGLPANKPYLLYGMGNGNQNGQGSTWWADAANTNGPSNVSASANFALGDRNATLASNEGVCWVKLPVKTTAAGALVFRVVRLGAAENGTGGSGRAYLNAFQLQPLFAPLIGGLTNQTVIAGRGTVLSPTVTGTPTPSFQWRSNSVAFPGATNASLTLSNIQYAQNATTYALVGSNAVGAATNSMTLTVLVTPSIAGLTDQAVSPGVTVTNAPTVSGVPTPSSRWQFQGNDLSDGATGNGSTVAGSATSTLVIVNAQAADSGAYSLIASNSAGWVTNSMTLTVSSGDVPPSITGPMDQTVVQTSNATFTASVSGLPLPALQWWVNENQIVGETNASLTVSNVHSGQNGFVYALVALNRAGQATNRAALSVLVPPVISQPPTSLSVLAGTPATFAVIASGVPAVTCQWSRNGSPIANATNFSYTIASVSGADNGAVFSVTVSNRVGTAIGSNALLTVLSSMTGTFFPTNSATGISPDQPLRIVFSSAPRLGSGKFYVRDAATGAVVATIDTSLFLTITLFGATITNNYVRTVQGASYFYQPIAICGKEAWITLNPTNHLAYNKSCYVAADAGLFLDATNAAFPAIAGTNTWRFSTKTSGPVTPTPSTGPTNLTIALDGAGDFATLQGAADWVPQNNTLKRTFTILPGVYRDYAVVQQNRNNISFIGAGASRRDVQLIYLYPSGPSAATLSLSVSDIYVRNLTIDNDVYHTNSGVVFAGPINTVFTAGNRIVFDNVLLKGGQDTLYANGGIQYFSHCEIWGSVDFIYGDALAVFDQCDIVEIRSTGGPITAPSTPYAQPHGEVFLNCTFPRALIVNGYPYDVGTSTTTFQRPWRQDGMTAVIECALGSQFTTKGWAEWGGRETTCRALEAGSTLIGGGSVSPAQRQAAGAYWLNTIDPDYTSASMDPTNALLYPPAGPTNRVARTVNTNEFTLDAIFGHAYYNLGSWRPATLPTITAHPTNQTASVGSAASFSSSAFGQPPPSYQWRKNGATIAGATNSLLTIPSVKLVDNGTYSVIVSNSVGLAVSSNATLTVPPPLKTALSPRVGGDGTLSLSWPSESTGFRLEMRTIPPNLGLSGQWSTVAGSEQTNREVLPVVPALGPAFFRLVYP